MLGMGDRKAYLRMTSAHKSKLNRSANPNLALIESRVRHTLDKLVSFDREDQWKRKISGERISADLTSQKEQIERFTSPGRLQVSQLNISRLSKPVSPQRNPKEELRQLLNSSMSQSTTKTQEIKQKTKKLIDKVSLPLIVQVFAGNGFDTQVYRQFGQNRRSVDRERDWRFEPLKSE